MTTINFSVYDDDFNEVICFCKMYSGRKGRMYMPNGDPGYPEEPGECDLVSATIRGTDALESITDDLREVIDRMAWEVLDDTERADSEHYKEMLQEYRMLHGDDS